MLLEHSENPALGLWRVLGRQKQGILMMRRGDVSHGLDILRSTYTTLRKSGGIVLYGHYLADFAEGLAEAGEIAEAASIVDEGLEQSDRNEERFFVAELRRINGDIARRGSAREAILPGRTKGC